MVPSNSLGLEKVQTVTSILLSRPSVSNRVVMRSSEVKYLDASFYYATKKKINSNQFQIQMLPSQRWRLHNWMATVPKANRPNRRSTGMMLSYLNIWLLEHLHLVSSFQCSFTVLFMKKLNAVMKVCTRITLKIMHSNQNALK